MAAQIAYASARAPLRVRASASEQNGRLIRPNAVTRPALRAGARVGGFSGNIMAAAAEPEQIEKLLEKPEALEKLVTRKAIGERLVPLSDKRDAIDIKGEVEALPMANAIAPANPINAVFDEVYSLLREQAENATRAPQSDLMRLIDLGDEPHTADPDPDNDLELLLGETSNDTNNEETEEELIF